jgi:hypothetical protein
VNVTDEEGWLAATDPAVMLALLPARVSSRRCRLLACACVRKVWWNPNGFGCQLAVDTAERMCDGPVPEDERNAAVATIRSGEAEASNAWSYLVAAAAATLHPSGIDAADLALDNLDSFSWELFDRSSHGECVALVRDIFGNPFRPTFDPTWQTSTSLALARLIYDSRDFSAMPILADALQDAGCNNAEVLDHCREPGSHVRGCWVIDLILGKE